MAWRDPLSAILNSIGAVPGALSILQPSGGPHTLPTQRDNPIAWTVLVCFALLLILWYILFAPLSTLCVLADFVGKKK